jgi:enoyl-CoA hydratase
MNLINLFIISRVGPQLLTEMSMGTVHARLEEGVLTLTLENGPANSMSLAMARELDRQIERAVSDPAVGAVVVTGSGTKAFCAGSDIAALKAAHESGDGPAELLRAENAAFDRLAGLDIPTIAAVNGLAVGGGVELAVCCDVILAAEDASLSLPEIRLGVFPGIGGTVRIPRRIGHGRAMELMLTGREVYAEEAQRIGLVDRLAPRDAVLSEADKLARRFAVGPRRAQAALKQAMRLSAELPERAALDRVLEMAVALGDSREVAEGLRAFLAKEKPDFRKLR